MKRNLALHLAQSMLLSAILILSASCEQHSKQPEEALRHKHSINNDSGSHSPHKSDCPQGDCHKTHAVDDEPNQNETRRQDQVIERQVDQVEGEAEAPLEQEEEGTSTAEPRPNLQFSPCGCVAFLNDLLDDILDENRRQDDVVQDLERTYAKEIQQCDQILQGASEESFTPCQALKRELSRRVGDSDVAEPTGDEGLEEGAKFEEKIAEPRAVESVSNDWSNEKPVVPLGSAL